jgi:hypothetical protein
MDDESGDIDDEDDHCPREEPGADGVAANRA